MLLIKLFYLTVDAYPGVLWGGNGIPTLFWIC